jgi:hypothetical protein
MRSGVTVRKDTVENPLLHLADWPLARDHSLTADHPRRTVATRQGALRLVVKGLPSTAEAAQSIPPCVGILPPLAIPGRPGATVNYR